MSAKARYLTIKYLKIIFGSALYAIGFSYFAYPNGIVPGGVSGISMIFNLLIGTPVGIGIIIINIPLFIFSWKRFGISFIVSSLIGMLISSVFVDLFGLLNFVATDNILLAVVFSGVLKGAGLGIVYSTGATTGGIDIIAKFLRIKYQYINFGTIILILDIVIIAAYGVIFRSYDSVMYAIICMFINAKAVDLVMSGGTASKVCYIISNEAAQMTSIIAEKLHRGVTLINGEGAWSKQEKQIILCVIKQTQIVELKKIVKSIDHEAFMISCNSSEVFGNGFTDIAGEG